MPTDALRPIYEAVADSVRHHENRSDVSYPGYVWIDWDDLVRFAEAFGDRRDDPHYDFVFKG